jgi:hypothetical protein
MTSRLLAIAASGWLLVALVVLHVALDSWLLGTFHGT